MDDYISRSKLLADIEKYHVSEGYFQHWVELQPAAEVVSKEEYDALRELYTRLLESASILSAAVKEYERREENGEI